MIQERNEVTMNVKSIKKMAIVFLLLAIFVSLVGCGNVNEDTTSVSTESSEASSISRLNKRDFQPTRSMEERKIVTYTNYLSSDYVFDLAGYAEALGYTSLQSPVDKGVVMYAITRGDITWFVSCVGYDLTVYADCGDGCYYKTPTVSINSATGSRHTYYIKKGGKEIRLTDDSFYGLVGIFSYISKMENLSFDYLPGYSSITKYEGTPEYYSNGLINYMNHGKFLESKYMLEINETPYEI